MTEDEPEIQVPFKGMVVTPANCLVLIIEDSQGRDLLKVPDGVETNVKFSARIVRDGQEEEANKHILRAAVAMVAACVDNIETRPESGKARKG